ncbi:MAG TPA: hypothetical protein VHO06_16315 [Polyangia bacterium]|nr:hypothetical protein [Polyangia bacterium]
MTTRAAPPLWALLVLLGGCATAPAPAAPADRYSPAEMQHGPSLYETGRIAVVPPSSAGLHIDDGQRRPAPVAAPTRTASRHAHASRRPAPKRSLAR